MGDVLISQNAAHNGAQEIHQQILHGVNDADVQIAVFNANGFTGGGVDDGFRNVGNGNQVSGVVRVQSDGAEAGYDIILLGVEVEDLVGGELEKLPQNANGHGETKGDDGDIQRRQLKGRAVLIQQIHQREAHNRAQETIDGMQHGVPSGNQDVIVVDFSHDFCREDEQVDCHLKGGGNLNFELGFKKGRQQKQNQREHADRGAFVVSSEQAAAQGQKHQCPEDPVQIKGFSVCLDMILQLLDILI